MTEPTTIGRGYICDLCGFQSDDRAAILAHLRDAHQVDDPAELGSLNQDDGLLILRSGNQVTTIDLDAWLRGQLEGPPAHDDGEIFDLVAQLGFPLTANALRERRTLKRGDPMATQDFDDLWTRYMGAHATPAEWAAPGWDMSRILDDLRPCPSRSQMMEVANALAAGLEELGLPMTPTAELDTLTLTTAHAASSYGRPVLMIEGQAYGPADMTPAGVTGAALVNAWAGRFAGQEQPGRAAEMEAALRALWRGAMIGTKDGAGFVKVAPDVTRQVIAALRAS